MAGVTLRNAHQEIKRAAIERSLAYLLFLFFKLSLVFGLDFAFELELTLG